MKLQSTLTIRMAHYVLMAGALAFTSFWASAQSSCANENVLWTENFGSGTAAATHPDVLVTYQGAGVMMDEGTYRVVNNTQQKSDWHNSTDHTGNTNGNILVVNGEAVPFFQHVVERPSGYVEGNYIVSFYAMNVNAGNLCGPGRLLATIDVVAEYRNAADDAWVPLSGSPFIGTELAKTNAPAWVNVNANFVLPSLGSFFPTKIRITLVDETSGGCGNDFAIDDIKFSECPQGGPTPVNFLAVEARAKDAGVQIEWSTAMEVNNDYYLVERSGDGNTGWIHIAKLDGAGDTKVAQHYSVFDAHPLNGWNYYRVRQVDKDGESAFSRTVNVKINGAGSRITISRNPFYSTLSVQFSGSAHNVSASLVDMTGKIVARESWKIPAGDSRKAFNNISQLQQGLYILSIRDQNGKVLYNGKVVKQ